jgi:hypothetical protein
MKYLKKLHSFSRSVIITVVEERGSSSNNNNNSSHNHINFFLTFREKV